MYGYNYNPAFSTYPSTGGGHPGYDEREMWPARSPPNYALPAPYQYHDYERVPRGAAGVPPPPTSMSAATTTCAANCCCPRISQHQQVLRHLPAPTWQDSRPDYYQSSLNPTSSCSSMSNERSSVITHEAFEDHLPTDPREWSPHDVFMWLHWAARNYRLQNSFPERFQMNGKALCLMDASMFLYRVPEGGEILYQDFQCRLQRAVGEDRPYNR